MCLSVPLLLLYSMITIKIENSNKGYIMKSLNLIEIFYNESRLIMLDS